MLKRVKGVVIVLFLIATASCSGMGFYEPITMQMDVPPGPVEYQAGWRSGCRSALSVQAYANAFTYDIDFGNGIYFNDSLFNKGFGQGWFGCILHTSLFAGHASMKYMPLE